ncbi:hypothetical protein STEG23_029312 [Scotinomys teguina]
MLYKRNKQNRRNKTAKLHQDKSNFDNSSEMILSSGGDLASFYHLPQPEASNISKTLRGPLAPNKHMDTQVQKQTHRLRCTEDVRILISGTCCIDNTCFGTLDLLLRILASEKGLKYFPPTGKHFPGTCAKARLLLGLLPPLHPLQSYQSVSGECKEQLYRKGKSKHSSDFEAPTKAKIPF